VRKILCLLAILTALCAAAPAYADNALNNALEYLSAVGIDLEYEEETIQPDQRVTRASFAELIVKLLNMSDAESDTVYYHDVSADHWAFGKIGALTENGILSGNEYKYFRPDDYITKNEAATILISALGYRVEAEGKGGFPDGYIRTAGELELFDDTSYSPELTLSDAIIIMRNALDVKLLKLIYKESDLGYEKSDDVTLLSYYHEKHYAKGILEGCDGVTIKSTNRINDDLVIIDGIEYKAKQEGLLNLIGTKVEFIYEVDEKNDERYVVWVKSLGHSDSLDIQKDEADFYNPAASVFSYVPEDRDGYKNINLSRGLVLIYNGAVATGSYDAILNSDKYRVRFIKSHQSSVYDIAIVWKYDNMVVGSVDIDQGIIYDKFNASNVLDISEIRDKIEVEGGQDIEQLVDGDIISIFESEDGELLRIEVSKNTCEVTAKYVGDGDTGKVLYAEDKDYLFYDNNANFSVLYGEKVKLYLDKNGYIVYVESVKVSGFPAYLISAKYDDMEEEVFIKTLDYDGNIVKRSIVKKTYLDGSKEEQFEIYDKLAPGGTTNQQVIILELEEDGSIKSIDTPYLGMGQTDKNSLTLVESNYSGYYKHHGAFFPKYIFSSDAVMFYPPLTESDKADERNYLVKSGSDLQNNDPYTADVYRYSKDTGYVNLVVLKSGKVGTATDKNYILVDEIKTAVNEDGDIVEKLICYSRGTAMEYFTTPDYSLRDAGIISGDVIGIVTNTSGKIKSAQRKYEYDKPFTTTKYMVPNNTPSFHKGYVHSKIGNVLRVRYDEADFESAFVISEDMIVVYDANEREKIRKGTMWDFTPGARVVFQTNDENPILMVIYK